VVDKLVGDIYGEDYKGLGLSADTVLPTASLRPHTLVA
jgi:hypothetical protein